MMDTDATDPCDLTAIEQHHLIASGQLSARELLQSHLERIADINPVVNAVFDVRAETGVQRAEAVDAALARGEDPGSIAGVVVGHKDLIEVEGFRTTFGTPTMSQNVASSDSQIAARVKDAGGVVVAKTNIPEFGAGSHTFNPVHGLTRNPWDLTRTSGGSSGGAAVALATGMVSIADGSDEGGSLRNPAAWAGVVGLRPTPGVVPNRFGNPWNPVPLAGPMARNVDDLALFLAVLNQREERDPLWRAIDCSTPIRPLGHATVAWSSDMGGLPIEAPIRDSLRSARVVVESMGWAVEEAEPDLRSTDEVFESLRHWRKSLALDPFRDSLDTIKPVLREELAKADAMSGHDTYLALVELNRIRSRALDFFDRYDLLLAPVTQVDPFPVDWEYPTSVDGVAMHSYIEWMRVCSRVTVLGCPALSLPVGFSAAGLPVGMQVIGRPGADAFVLAAAKAIEDAIGPLPMPDLARLIESGEQDPFSPEWLSQATAV